jgi:hypothetical protein
VAFSKIYTIMSITFRISIQLSDIVVSDLSLFSLCLGSSLGVSMQLDKCLKRGPTFWRSGEQIELQI